MDYKLLGRTKTKLSEIGIGTWKIPNDSEAGIDAIRYGIGGGVNFVDTAEMYGNEEMVGKAIAGREVFLATKVSPSHFEYDNVIKACESSLRRLGRESIDLYQLHWPNKRIPISETMRAMEKLQDEGKIRYIGVSNFSIEELVEAQACLSHSEIVSNQVEYSILVRDVEEEMLEFCNKEKITLIAYSPLARGAILDKELLGMLRSIGSKYGKTPVQVALNYLISSSSVIPIPKAISAEHMKENIGAAGWRLSEKDYSAIRNLEGFRKKPLAGKLLKVFLKNTSVWSDLMERMEKNRKA